MKILQINAVYKYASTGRTCMELQDVLNAESGIECFTAFASGNETFENTYKIINNKFDQKIHGLLARVTGLAGYYSTRATKRLISYIKEQRFDVVHMRNLHSNYINVNMLLKYLSSNNIATVVTLHDCWLYTGKCTHYTVDNCYLWKTGCHSCVRLKKDIPSLFFDRTKKMYNDKKKYFGDIKKLAVVGVSDWITQQAKQSLLGKAKIVKRIYNWINLDVFKPTESDLRKKYNVEDKFVILSVCGKWTAEKGLPDMISIAETLDDSFMVVLVGRFPDEIKISEKVISIGTITDVNLLAKIYSMADCYVSTSSEESFGKTVAEAISCGTPAIVYNQTALPELVQNGCGYVVFPNNVEQMCDKIKEIRTKGKNCYLQYCREFAEQNFDMHKNINEYIRIYNELIE